MLKFRPLHPAEILLKPNIVITTDGQGNKKSLTEFIPYKNARADMCILDECVGPDNWQRDHKDVDGAFMCGIGIYSDKHKQFIWKWDAGSSNGAADVSKSSASDSFKRAGFSWGIGRELYSMPRLVIPTDELVYDLSTIPATLSERVWVTAIEYEENESRRFVKYVRVETEKSKLVYEYGKESKVFQKISNKSSMEYEKELLEKDRQFLATLTANGVNIQKYDEAVKNEGYESLLALPDERKKRAMEQAIRRGGVVPEKGCDQNGVSLTVQDDDELPVFPPMEEVEVQDESNSTPANTEMYEQIKEAGQQAMNAIVSEAKKGKGGGIFPFN